MWRKWLNCPCLSTVTCEITNKRTANDLGEKIVRFPHFYSVFVHNKYTSNVLWYYRSLSGHAPGYLADDCQLLTDPRARLHVYCVPLTWGQSTVHRTSSCFGDRSAGTSQLRPQECGTVCRRTYEKQSYHTPGSGGRWRHFYFIWIIRHCELFLTAPRRNILTYLLNRMRCFLSLTVTRALGAIFTPVKSKTRSLFWLIHADAIFLLAVVTHFSQGFIVFVSFWQAVTVS